MVWVDHFLLLSTKESLNDNIEQDLNVYFKVKSLGKPNLLLGIKINIGNDLISLTDANPVSTPMDPNVKLDITTESDGEQ